ISSGFGNITSVVMMVIGALAIIDGKMSIGDLMVFQTLSGYFTQPVQNLVNLQLTYQEAQIAMKRLGEIMELEVENTDGQLLQNIDLTGDIDFSNVTFHYGSRAPIIQNFNLFIKTGTKL